MKIKSKMLQLAIAGFAFLIIATGCDKTDRPVLGDYPKDTNPPGGPLKFYAAMDSRAVDSIRANFGVNNGATFVSGGASGGAVQLTGASNGYVSFPSANDFGKSTDFTISFWMNITLAQKDNGHAVGVLSVASSSNFWGNITFYADNNTQGTTPNMDLKIHFANDGGDNWDFAGYNFANAWPNMYDGQWHQVAFTYNAASKTGTVYRDGVQKDQKTNEVIKFKDMANVVVGGFQQAANLQGNYAGNTWMAGFPGKIDQLRLYGTTLSAAEIMDLYNGKK